jgi:hypothetical protein
MAPEPADAAQQRDSRKVTCAGRVYILRRLADGIVALYDENERLLAGWPLTAFWPPEWLGSKADEEWCALLRAMYGQR